MKNKKNAIKIIGIVATVVGTIATLVSEWADDAVMEDTIEEKVNEILAEKEAKGE